MSVHIGIDPGLSGGIAVIDPEMIFITPMPQTERDMWEFLVQFSPRNPEEPRRSYSLIEKAHAFPGSVKPVFCPRCNSPLKVKQAQGVGSTAKSVGNYLQCRMALIAAGIPFETIAAAQWQKGVGIPPRGKKTRTQHKNVLKARAQELFPDVKVTLKTCDALLIAEFSRRMRR